MTTPPNLPQKDEITCQMTERIGVAYPKQERRGMKGLSRLCPIELETNMPPSAGLRSSMGAEIKK
jgi:hypothetical protein